MKETLFNSYIVPLLNLDTYIINDEIIKNRRNSNVEESSIADKINNFENIGIQKGEQLEIYCDSYRKDAIMTHIDKVDGPLSKAWEQGEIIINSI